MIRDHSETGSVASLYRKHFEKPADKPQSNGHHPPIPPARSERSDEEIIEKARAEKNGKFERLWNGDTSDYNNDHSDADDGFVHKLYSYTQDEEQIRRIHTDSGLYRSGKSGTRHKYLQYSIDRARNNTTWFYEWNGSRLAFGAGVGVKLSGAESSNGQALESTSEDSNGHTEFSEKEIGILLSTVEAERVSWLWPDRIPLGKLSIVDGDPGTGKSGLTGDLAARVSAGTSLPDGYSVETGGVVLLSAEDGLSDTIRPRLDAAGADTSKVLALATTPDSEGYERMISIPEDIPLIEQGIRRVEASLVVVDPLMAFLSGEVNAHKDSDVRRALAPLAAMAERSGAAVVVVRHLNKASGGNALYRGGGSIGIIGAARSALLVAKDPEDENRRVLAPLKSNLARSAPSLAFTLEEAENGAVRVVWQGDTDLDASKLLGTPAAREEGDAHTEATDFLREILRDGPVPARQVKEEAEDVNIKERTLARAKKSLSVETYREGKEGKRGGGEWLWEIPTIKVANPEGWQPKPEEPPEGTENPAYLSQKKDTGLRMPGDGVVKDAGKVGNLNPPGSRQPQNADEKRQAERLIDKLVAEGMEPDLARQEVLGIAEF